MRKKIKQKTVIFLLVLLVIGGSLFVLIKPQPETVHLSSRNGNFDLSGQVRNSTTLKFKKRENIAVPFLFASSVYEIDFGQTFLAKALLLQLKNENPELDFQSSSIYAYDPSILAWRRQNSFFDFKRESFSLEIDQPFKLWTVAEKQKLGEGDLKDVSLQTFEGMLNELLAWPLEKAVGYQVYLSFSWNDRDFILLTDQVGYGGCQGNYQEGLSETLTSSEKKVADKFYRLSVVWQLDEGCLQGEKIESSQK